MKESAYVRDRETRDPLVYKLSLRTPCRWQTLWHVLALLKVAVLLKMGGKVAGTQNLEKGTDMSVFLSAPWFLLTVGKPCCSARGSWGYVTELVEFQRSLFWHRLH